MTAVSTSAAEANAKSTHTLSVDRRSHVVITGVLDVYSFQEQEVVLKIDSGEMVLTGQNLHISKLLLDNGQLSVDGRVDGVQYQGSPKHEEKKRLWRRLVK